MLRWKINLMLDLSLHLKLHLRVHTKEPSKMHKKLKKKSTFDVARDGVLEEAFVNESEIYIKKHKKVHLR